MDDGVHPSVEFLNVDGCAGDDTGVASGVDPARPAAQHRLRNATFIAAALMVAAGAAGWARRTNDAPARDDASPSPASPAPVGAAVRPATIADPVYALVGPCPPGAQCFVSAPAAAEAALRSAFPGAVPVAAASILANRAGHSDPGLLRRVILAERGRLAIQVRVQAGPVAGAEPARRPSTPQRAPRGIARIAAQQAGYAISVVVIGPGASASTGRATRLADDLRLLSP